MFATGSRTSHAAEVDPPWAASTDRAAASSTPRGTNTPSIILSPDRESEHRGKAGRPARTETCTSLRAGGEPNALSPPRARPPSSAECAPVLARVKVVRPVGRSTLTPAPGRQRKAITRPPRSQSLPTHAQTGPTTGKDLTA